MIDSSPRQVAQREQWTRMFGPARLAHSPVAGGSQPIQRTLSSARPGDVVQRAGTKPNQPSVDGKYRIKLSSEREKFSYDNRVALRLDAVLPGHHDATHARLNKERNITAVKLRDGTWVSLKEPIPQPGPGQRVLVIDTVGFQPPRDEDERPVRAEKLFMDIKIGHFTKSGQQFQLEGAGWFMQVFKQLEHDMKDLWRTSNDFGYDIDADNLKDFEAAHSKARSRQPSTLKAAMRALWDPLQAIATSMARAPVTFVGASVFMVFNLTAPQDSAVKIIDPDHPIVLDSPPDLAIPGGVMTGAKMKGDRDWDDYKMKWQGNFGSGMSNFVKWFAARHNELPSPQ